MQGTVLENTRDCVSELVNVEHFEISMNSLELEHHAIEQIFHIIHPLKRLSKLDFELIQCNLKME